MVFMVSVGESKADDLAHIRCRLAGCTLNLCNILTRYVGVPDANQ